MRLSQVHDVIQATMGWTDTHLHAFSTAYGDYGPPDPELDHRDERKARLTDFLAEPGDRIRYAYDFGDFLEHDIVLEKKLEPDPGVRLPACVAGKGACPPEDCGGVWRYADLRDTLANPASEEHDAMLEWLALDSAEGRPSRVRVDETNEILGMASASRR
jgi:hypothetical protein